MCDFSDVIQETERQKQIKESELAQEMTKAAGSLYETPGFSALIEKAGEEGMILLENQDHTLPFRREDRLAIFGRCQCDTFYVGYGSGGDVNPTHRVSILDGMQADDGLTVDQKLADIYRQWCTQNPPDEGVWGSWPYHYAEMQIDPAIVRAAADRTDRAVVVIGRAAGEDRENTLTPGSYYITADEKQLLSEVNAAFSSVTVLLNIGNIMDLSWIRDYPNIRAVLLVWQLGQETGTAVASVLSGQANPSGHLTDTVAYQYKDYPSAAYFGDPVRNEYKEGIFTGYRHFETSAKEAVLYPFGYGLSYADFAVEPAHFDHNAGASDITASVRNAAGPAGKDVLMLFVGTAPLPGKDALLLPEPAVRLVDFKKTRALSEGETDEIAFAVNDFRLSAYDDTGVTGHPSAWVLEAGVYTFYVGDSVRNLHEAGQFTQAHTVVTKQCERACTLKPEELRARILGRLPASIEERLAAGTDETSQKSGRILLQDVRDGKATLDAFIAQLSNRDLSDLSRGEGPMNSSFGTPGNAGMFGGTTEALRSYGIPPLITSDGPAGIRLMRYAALLPIGTALASSWNTELIEDLYAKEAEELEHYKVDVFLAPGINIHRNPLCGRNFEYYSEDPLLSGRIAAAAVRGIQSRGASACVKHFACNSQETARNREDSVLDERTLREIYLKAFEICVKEAHPMNLMTSYNKVNGVYSHYHYDLVTTILRNEWGYDGCVITDWWMQPAESPEFPGLRNNAYRIRAGVNVLMPGSEKTASKGPFDDPETLACMDPADGGTVENGLTRGELEENARHVLTFALRRMAPSAD